MGNAKNIPADTLLLPFQSRWAHDTSRLKIAEKSRQIGWTWTTAYALVARKISAASPHDAWISSRDEIQSRLFLEDCRSFARARQTFAELERILLAKGQTAHVLRFRNGLRIHSMTSNPDAQAGKRGDRILDEFALHPDPRKLYAIAYPGITWGGSLEIFSTHRGTANFFNELLNEIKHQGNPKNFSHHRVTLQNALDEGLLYKLQQKLPPDDERQAMDESAYFEFIRRGCPDEETFQQEYLCQPSDDHAAFLSYDLIATCKYPPGEIWQTDLRHVQGRLFVGVDIGRDHDLTVIWVFERLADVDYTRRVISLKNAPFDAQEFALYEILDNPHVRRCCIDCTGLGRQFSERARKRYGEYRVEPVTFTNPMKEELAYPVRTSFQERTLRIPDDPAIIADLRAIKKETTTAGNLRFTADRGKNGHADRFWALALARHAAGKPAPGLQTALAAGLGIYRGAGF